MFNLSLYIVPGAGLFVLTFLDEDSSPLGYEYTADTISPARISLMPILRSGLGMVDGEAPNVSADTTHMLMP